MSGLIVSSDLPDGEKYKERFHSFFLEVVLLLQVTYPSGKIQWKGLIVMGDLPKWKKTRRGLTW
jgi:hypothetical protein